VAALFVIALASFGSLGAGHLLYTRALEQARAGQIDGASRTLATAEVLNPVDERAPIAHADLLRQAIGLLPAEEAGARRALFEDAQEAIDRAIANNPERALVYAVRAQLVREYPGLAGAGGVAQTEAAYRQALRLNPLLHDTRTRYAEFLLEQRRVVEARELLEHGIAYRYYPHPDLLPYYRLTQRLRREAGDRQGAAALEGPIRALEEQAVSGNTGAPP
jgi:tetratricopeptide (TPR) repeat protein